MSTGRCGTQWLARTLAGAYADVAVVKHDPVGARYRPREFYRQWDRAHEVARIPDVAREIGVMRESIAEREYIDTGWASYAALPYLIAEFGEANVRIVHLVRHPVPTAVSLVSLDMYAPGRRRDEWTELGMVDPSTPHVALTGYATRWQMLSAFEKCLFWWTEINQYAEDLSARYPRVSFIRVQAEEMFSAEKGGLRRITDHFGLPYRPAIAGATGERYDRWRFGLDEVIDWRQANNHPELLALMKKYGYSLDEIADVVARDLPAGAAKPWRS